MVASKLLLAALGLGASASMTTAEIQPLITSIFTADPSAHVFNNRVYVYPSHDHNTSNNGYDMDDYRILSMDTIGGAVKDNGVALKLANIPWASKQLWAPDALYRNGVYYLYFPARDTSSVFRIGVATSTNPIGPFVAETKPIVNSYSVDPAVFVDDDGQTYMYFGGMWDGQLQCWQTDTYNASQATLHGPTGTGVKALGPRVAIMNSDLKSFKTKPVEISLLDTAGKPLLADDHDHRFFEASWMHKYNGKYYFSYSTGDTHFMAYAIGTSPLGPFTFTGHILEPVMGWTTHGSIIQFQSKWYLFYHDSICSGGDSTRRCVKVREIFYDSTGKITLTNPAA